MSNLTLRRTTLALVLSAFVAAPTINLARAAGSDTPSPPASDTKSQPKDKKKSEKKS